MYSVTRDDIDDVTELSTKIENEISNILYDHDKNIAMSALTGATINYMLSHFENLEMATFYRNVFVEILDDSILYQYQQDIK